MKITKEDIEESIHEYNKAIKKLEDAGIDYGDYTVTIHHTRWIKLLTLLKTHIEAWEKVIDDINNYNISPDKPKDYVRGNLDCQILILDIIDKHLKSKEGDTDG